MTTPITVELKDIDHAVEQLFTPDDAQRRQALRALFVEKLDFELERGAIPMPSVEGIPMPNAHRIAQRQGVTVVFVAAPSDSVLAAAALSKLYKASTNTLGDVLLVCTTSDSRHWQFVYPKLIGGKEVLRRLSVQQGQPRRTFVQQLRDLVPDTATRDIRFALEQLYNVDAVTKKFFTEYKRVFDAVMAAVVGLPDDEERRLFCQTLFNRLMFLYFLQRKGCLSFGDSTNYIKAIWDAYVRSRSAESSDASSFYRTRLDPLFFLALNNDRGENYDAIGFLENKIGRVPFLNGGLFAKDALDQRPGVDVPDSAIEQIITQLFERFNFTITESTPYDVEVAVDPEMLGKVFEELVTGRHESGSYYTPRPIVAFMGKEALKGYFAHAVPDESPEGIAAFVDDHSAQDLREPEAIWEAMRRVRICDPACGSGAYLLGMLQELLELRTHLFKAHGIGPDGVYKRKLEIIQENLYGVDIDLFAVNIARLRLWLSLIVNFEGASPPPLPNLDFKIEQGDSLTAPSPATAAQSSARTQLIPLYRSAKARFAIAHGEEKRHTRVEVEDLRKNIATWTHGSSLPNGAFDWAVDFAEVFAEGGFDIILANPPYVRQELIKDLKPALKKVYPDVYNGIADLYCYFYARGLQLLRSRGMLAFISSNKWLKAGYGTNLRTHMARTCRIRSITDFGDLPVFEAASAYPMILVAQKESTDHVATTYTEVQSLDAPYPEVREIIKANGYPLLADALAGEDWIITDPYSARCFERILGSGNTLGQYVKGEIYRGVITGLNKAFVINGNTRRQLIARNPKCIEIIKPLVAGKSLLRWRTKDADNWLILTPVGIDIGLYPAVLQHLVRWENGLATRWDRGKEWWELRPCDYYEAFEQPKIMYPDIAQTPRFVLDMGGGYYTLNTAYFFPCDQPWIAAVLNSNAVEFFLAHLSPPVRGGYLRFYTSYVEKIPLPIPREHIQERLTQAALRLTAADDEQEERAIQQLVYEHVYNLTPDEARHVEQWVQRRRASLKGEDRDGADEPGEQVLA